MVKGGARGRRRTSRSHAHEPTWARPRCISVSARGRFEKLAFQGQGRDDQLPAGRPGLRQVGGDPPAWGGVPRRRRLGSFEPYAPYGALAWDLRGWGRKGRSPGRPNRRLDGLTPGRSTGRHVVEPGRRIAYLALERAFRSTTGAESTWGWWTTSRADDVADIFDGLVPTPAAGRPPPVRDPTRSLSWWRGRVVLSVDATRFAKRMPDRGNVPNRRSRRRASGRVRGDGLHLTRCRGLAAQSVHQLRTTSPRRRRRAPTARSPSLSGPSSNARVARR